MLNVIRAELFTRAAQSLMDEYTYWKHIFSAICFVLHTRFFILFFF